MDFELADDGCTDTTNTFVKSKSGVFAKVLKRQEDQFGRCLSIGSEINWSGLRAVCLVVRGRTLVDVRRRAQAMVRKCWKKVDEYERTVNEGIDLDNLLNFKQAQFMLLSRAKEAGESSVGLFYARLLMISIICNSPPLLIP